MNNWNDFIGKKVKITVAFATGMINVGPAPQFFCGIVKNINDDTITLSDASKIIFKGFSKEENLSVNNVLINKNYIILIEEI